MGQSHLALYSQVTGQGLDYVRLLLGPLAICYQLIIANQLRTFLNLLPSSEGDEEKFSLDDPLEYSVTEVWSVPYVGTGMYPSLRPHLLSVVILTSRAQSSMGS